MMEITGGGGGGAGKPAQKMRQRPAAGGQGKNFGKDGSTGI